MQSPGSQKNPTAHLNFSDLDAEPRQHDLIGAPPCEAKKKKLTIAEHLQLKHLRSLGSIFSTWEKEKTDDLWRKPFAATARGVDPEDPEMCALLWAVRRGL